MLEEDMHSKKLLLYGLENPREAFLHDVLNHRVDLQSYPTLKDVTTGSYPIDRYNSALHLIVVDLVRANRL